VSTNLESPPSRQKAVLIQAIGGYVNNIVQAAQALLLVPLCLSALGERFYGFWLATGGILAWLNVVDIGAGAVMLQRVAAAYAQRDQPKAKSYFRHGLILSAALCACLLVVAFAVGLFVPGWLGADMVYQRQLGWAFVISSAAVAMSFLGSYCRDFAIALQHSTVPTAVMIASDVGSLALTIGGLLGGFGLWALVAGAVFRGAILLSGCGAYAVHLDRALGQTSGWTPAIFRDFLVTTPWTLLAKSSAQLVSQLPAVLLTRVIGPEATVAYVVTARAVALMDQLCNQIVASCYGPLSHHFHSDPAERIRATLRTLTGVILLVGLVGAAGYGAGIRTFVALWTGPSYFLGDIAGAAFAAGILVGIWNRWGVMVLLASGRIVRGSVLSFAETGLRGVGLVLGIVLAGSRGAPVGLLIGSLVMAVPTLRAYNSIIGAWIAYREFALGVGVSCSVLAVSTLVSVFVPSNSWVVLGACEIVWCGSVFCCAIILVPGLRQAILLRAGSVVSRVSGASWLSARLRS
jgi:O-antigen/teichoic acid export membrane protein